MLRRQWLLLILIPATTAGSRPTQDFAALCEDRRATERVYYNHRVGNKPPFEKTMPPELIEKLVREDLHKEAVLKKAYGIAVTPALLDTEVQRINLSTRAPDMLAELKAALDNDTNRFARIVAKPILVERILRDRFENDDAVHAPQRRQAEIIRSNLLNAKRASADPAKLVALLKEAGSNQVSETAWQLQKPKDDSELDRNELLEVQKRFGPHAQILESAHRDTNSYFDDLPPDLRRVLQVQLRAPGDISAVIETPGDFRLYLCQTSTRTTLATAALSISKRSYEQWLAQQAN